MAAEAGRAPALGAPGVPLAAVGAWFAVVAVAGRPAAVVLAGWVAALAGRVAAGWVAVVDGCVAAGCVAAGWFAVADGCVDAGWFAVADG